VHATREITVNQTYLVKYIFSLFTYIYMDGFIFVFIDEDQKYHYSYLFISSNLIINYIHKL